MKHVWVWACIGILWGLSGLQAQPLNLAPLELLEELRPLKGAPNVQSRRTYLYRYEQGALFQSALKQRQRFQANGLLAESVSFSEQGEVVRSISLSYDSLQRLQVKQFYNARDSLQRQQVFGYDEAGQLVSQKNFSGPALQLTDWTLYEYDSCGNRLALRHYRGDTLRINRQGIQHMEYASTGQLLRQDFLNAYGLIYQSYWYTYDSLGRETEFLSMDETGRLLFQRETRYHETGYEQRQLSKSGQVLSRTEQLRRSLSADLEEVVTSTYVGDRLHKRITRRHDAQGRPLLLKRELFSPNSPQGVSTERLTYTYNAFGLLSEVQQFLQGQLHKRWLMVYEYQP